MKLSVITVNYNNKEGLRLTVESVLGQSLREIEYIVIDGQSTDGSFEVLAAHDNRIDSWLSEPDLGVYYAMNKGISLASGDYVFFLNSGDTFYKSSVLEDVHAYLYEEHDIVFGDVNIISGQGSLQSARLTRYPERLRFSYLFKRTICHQALFLRRSLFDRVGLYSEKYKLCSDWAHLVSALIDHEARHKKVPLVIANYPKDGMSSMQESKSLIMDERRDFLMREYSAFYDDYLEYTSLTNNRAVSLVTAIQKSYFRRKAMQAMLKLLSVRLHPRR